MERAKKQIGDAFQVLDFEPRELFIATWDQVGYYKEKSRKVNTFQAVIGMYKYIFRKTLIHNSIYLSEKIQDWLILSRAS